MNMQTESFRDQVVLITGAASGFGALLATRLASMGARLVLGDRNEPGLAAIAGALQDAHGKVVAQCCDVTCEAEVKALVELALTTFGRLDIGVNNAGMTCSMKAFIDTEESDLDMNFAVNAKGVFFGMKHQIPPMLRQGGG